MGTEFGTWLAARREALRLSQAEVAARAVRRGGPDAGTPLTVGTVSIWERGERTPTGVYDIDALAQALGVALKEALMRVPGLTLP